MMINPSDSNFESNRQQEPNVRSSDSTSRRALENAFELTASLKSEENEIRLADMAELLQVARRLRGVAFQLDPVVIEMVHVLLAQQLKKMSSTNQQFSAVVAQVARTLFENPETHERLRSLWARLSAVE